MADHVLQRRLTGRETAGTTSPLLLTALYSSIAIGAAVVAMVSGWLLYDGWSQQRHIYPGVRVGGIDVSGLSQAEAEAKLEERLPGLASEQIQLTYGDRAWDLPASALGVTYDARESAARALAYGHEGDLWRRSVDLLRTRRRGVTVPLSVTVSDEAAFQALARLAPDVVTAPTNAEFRLDGNGHLAIDPGREGVGLDTRATVGRLRQRLEMLSAVPVPIQTTRVAPSIQTSDLQPIVDGASALAGQPLVLSRGTSSWEVPPAALQAMLRYPEPGQPLTVSLSRELLSTYLAQLAPQVQRAGQDASVVRSGNGFAVVPGVPGEQFDLAATTDAAIAALAQGQHEVEIRTRTTQPAVGDAEARQAAERANSVARQPFTLTWTGGSIVVPSSVIAQALRVEQRPGGSPPFGLAVDDVKLGQALAGFKEKVASPPRDAQLRYLDGKVTVVTPAEPGTALDVQRTVAAVHEALADGRQSTAVVVTKVEPKVTGALASGIVIRERLSSGQTSYAGSVPNRRYNVELAVSRVNGALIAPGATFSFTGTIGAVDTANGYKVGYGIEQTSNGRVTTVPSVGGGICQVATTAFHAVWWSGMPIAERNWHFYWIPNYGVAPSGITGLDATVDTDANLDFKFKNATDSWLALVATADGQNVRFELWGTDPGWKIQVDEPVVTNTVKADTTMKYQPSDTLKQGETVLVEHATDGFDAALHRRVTKGDQVIDDVTLKSRYVPSENITLVGTG